VSELDKCRIFIYIPWTKSGLFTLNTHTLTGLFAKNPFILYGLSYSDTSQGQSDYGLSAADGGGCGGVHAVRGEGILL
jgi:hypothetical protein